jgi:hypothetical protein
VSEWGCRGEEGGEVEGGEGDEGAGMDEGAGAGISEPAEGVGSMDAIGDEDRTCSCACEVLTRVARDVTSDSKAEMILCAAACRPCNELDSRFELARKLREALNDGVGWAREWMGLVVVFEGQVVHTHPQARRLRDPGSSEFDTSSPSLLLLVSLLLLRLMLVLREIAGLVPNHGITVEAFEYIYPGE